MSNLMSAPRKALLEHLATLPEGQGLHANSVAEIAGISPRSLLNFRNALVEDELAALVWPPLADDWGIVITDKGREAVTSAVVPAPIETKKTHDRSADLAEIIADPLTVRANPRDLYRHLVEGQSEMRAARNMHQAEELLALLNGVVRLHAGAR